MKSHLGKYQMSQMKQKLFNNFINTLRKLSKKIQLNGFGFIKGGERCRTVTASVRLSILIISVLFLGCQAQNHLLEAESFSEAGKFEDAIKSYELHIEARLKEDRKEWENPHFYQIRIAELYLKLNNSEEALRRIKLAEDKKVEKDLILDGIREVAEYFAVRNKVDEAIDLLDSYRSFDESYIDGLVDKIVKKSGDLSPVQESSEIKN